MLIGQVRLVPSVRVAVVTGLGVVSIPPLIIMHIGHVTLLMGMAVQATEGIGAAGGVTRGTGQIMVPTQGKGVRKAGGRPGRGCMAPTAVMGKAQRSVIRGPLIIGVMATVAVCGQAGEAASGVTLGTVEAAMPSGEGKAAVVKDSRGPGAGAVAVFAGV